MASIHPNFSTRPDPSLYKLNLRSPKIFLSQPKLFYFSSLSPQYLSDSSTLCCCNNSRSSGSISGDDDSQLHRWNSAIQDAFRNAKASFDEFVNSSLSQSRKKSDGLAEKEDEGCKDDGGEWDWERWWKHFGDIDEQQRILFTLKSQLGHAVTREDYEDAARLKVAIAAASANDTVGRVMSYLDKAVKEERYRDAVLLRDYAGAGLVGWWAGVSENTVDPYGCIINISAEHGRYVARSFSPRQLASSMDGATLFEIFFIVNDKGDYRHQAVYLKRSRDPPNNAIPPPNVLGAANNFDSLGPTENNSVVLKETDDDTGDSADSDEDSRFEDTLRDLIPGAKVKVLKVTTPGKVDRDFISKVVEQIIEEDDDDDDDDVEENDDDDLKSTDDENNEKNGDILDVDSLISDNNNEDNSQIAVKVVVHGLLSNLPTRPRQKDLLRVPAKLERKGRMSFTFTVEENGDDNNTHSNGGIGKALNVEKPKFQNQPSVDNVVLDLAKSIGKGRIPMKVLKDVSEMINLTVNQARRRQPLSGSTTFNRIDIPGTQDPLNGLYIGAHGLYTSEVVHLRHKYGQWKDDGHGKEPTKIEFYEYVEAVKLTGDPYLPAGQIAFRAKVGKGYQLPHRGIIPEEFGVIARYKGQGRLAEPGFKNPRWVDGELVILDGKHIKSGPVVGFLYWAPEYHFLVFFNRLRLHT